MKPGIIIASVAALLVALSACGAAGTAVTTPTHTPIPITPGHGVLYAFAANQGPNGPNSTDIYALGLGNGQQVWHTQVSGAGASAALGGGTLYLGSYQNAAGSTTSPQGTLQAFNASTGAPLWHVSPPSIEMVPVAANSDAVFAASLAFTNSQIAPTVALTALRASDGTALWNDALGQAPGGPLSAITLGDSALYLVTTAPPASGNTGPGQTMLSALDIASGKTLWQVPLPGVLTSSNGPVLSSGALYVAVQNFSQGGTLAVMAIQASDGKTLWSKAPPTASTVSEITVAGATLCYSYGLLYGPGGGLVALHAADGSASWQTDIQSGGPVPIVADTGAVYALESTKSAAPTLATTLNTFALSTGKMLLSQPIPNLPAIQVEFGVGTPLQVAHGALYVVGSGFSPSTATQQPPAVSIILALNTQTGAVLWQHQFNGSAQPGFLIAP